MNTGGQTCAGCYRRRLVRIDKRAELLEPLLAHLLHLERRQLYLN